MLLVQCAGFGRFMFADSSCTLKVGMLQCVGLGWVDTSQGRDRAVVIQDCLRNLDGTDFGWGRQNIGGCGSMLGDLKVPDGFEFWF